MLMMKPTIIILVIYFLITLATTCSAQEASASVSVKKAVLDSEGNTIPKTKMCLLTPAWKDGDYWNNTHVVPEDHGPDDRQLILRRNADKKMMLCTFWKLPDGGTSQITSEDESPSDAGTFRIEEREGNQDHRYKLVYEDTMFGPGEVGFSRADSSTDELRLAFIADNYVAGEEDRFTKHRLDFWFTDCIACVDGAVSCVQSS
ncbi:unnamed protein product [Microthlaspi erraticum]|uniref:Uncharacterized protein n=1 Tax=Microthlaspi erraticum TaxID=1685480 RepID=A0A6D2L7I2_9BRAS|nr:unnamed protein product [Microthlaspi erraticum]